MFRILSICVLSVSAALAGSAARAASSPADASSRAILMAQNFAPPGSIPGMPPDQVPPANDTAALLVRIDRLEDQVRSLNGQIEQLQFAQQKLQTALQKFQQDVDFRFQDVNRGKPSAHAPGRRSDASGVEGGSGAAFASDQDAPGPRRNDAFDPAAHPDAPGAPRSLGAAFADGSTADVIPAPAAAGGREAGSPLQLDNGPANAPAPASAPAQVGSGGQHAAEAQLAELAFNNPREDFDLALVSFHNADFKVAQSGFRSFLDHFPKDRLAPDAIYYLGESYWRLGKIREAAQQYLKISSDYPRSPHAPESLLKLGLSLEKLGSRDQACASFERISTKYPGASASVRAAAQRSMKRDQC